MKHTFRPWVAVALLLSLVGCGEDGGSGGKREDEPNDEIATANPLSDGEQTVRGECNEATDEFDYFLIEPSNGDDLFARLQWEGPEEDGYEALHLTLRRVTDDVQVDGYEHGDEPLTIEVSYEFGASSAEQYVLRIRCYVGEGDRPWTLDSTY